MSIPIETGGISGDKQWSVSELSRRGALSLSLLYGPSSTHDRRHTVNFAIRHCLSLRVSDFDPLISLLAARRRKVKLDSEDLEATKVDPEGRGSFPLSKALQDRNILQIALENLEATEPEVSKRAPSEKKNRRNLTSQIVADSTANGVEILA